MSDKIREQYKAFAQWCYDNRRPGLDPRLHQHGGPIEHGGYIADPKTAAAFAAWRAAIAQQPAPVAHEPVARAFGKVCGGDAEHNTVNVHVCGPVPPDLWTIGTAVALCAAPPAAEPAPCKPAQAAPVAQEPVAYVTADGERVITAKTYNDAKRDGGAMWSSVRPFTVAAYAAPPATAQPDTVAVPREVLRELTDTAITEWHDPSVNEAAQDRNECLCCGVEDGHNADCAVAIALRLLAGGEA